MDKKKISDSPIIPWAITLVLCLAIATLIRLVALAKGVDSGTANLVFVIVMGCCVVLYLIIWAILGGGIPHSLDDEEIPGPANRQFGTDSPCFNGRLAN